MKNHTSLILIIFLLLIQGCANQLPPGGGDIDTTPPEIVEVYPPDGTTNYEENYIELEFSEYVDKRTVNDAIFISPFLEGGLELDWSGKSVRIYFPEKLQENTTYVITIGTDVVDFNNRNRMAESYTLTFSTGDVIDRRIVTGKVYNEKPEGILIFAYKSFSDTINPSFTKPSYLSQTGKDGTFKIGGLSAGTYRVFAVDDDFRDLLFQPEQDRIGLPFLDVVLGLDDSVFTSLNFFLTTIDSVPPRFISAAMTDANHIIVTLSEPFDSSIISSDNYFIYDSTSGKRSDLLYAYNGATKPDEFVLVTGVTLNPENNVFLFADTLSDKQGNLFINEGVSLTVSERPDTIKPSIAATEPRPGSATTDFRYPDIFFRLNDAVDSAALKSLITFTDTLKRPVKHTINFIDDASFRLNPAGLEPQTDYIITINLPRIKDAAGNSGDSLYTFKFRTISGMDFTGISGTVSNVVFERNPVLVLQGTKDNKEVYQMNVNTPAFDFKRIRPGNYLLWGYYDEDSSGTYSYGNLEPFKYSEEFSFYPDTLNLRPRWVVTDTKFFFITP